MSIFTGFEALAGKPPASVFELPGEAPERPRDEPKMRAAVTAAKRGLYVFRIQIGRDEKNEYLKRGFKGWQAEATNDPEQVAALWRCPWGKVELEKVQECAWPKSREYNIGLRTGTPLPDGGYLFVLDIDTKKGRGGDGTLARLEQEHGALPRSYTVRSTTGGRHIYLRVPEPLTHGRENVLGDGLDVRCSGGLVMAAGSTFGDKAYVVEINAPIADCPEWMSDQLRKAHTAPEHVAVAVPGLEANGPGDLKWAKRYLENDAPHAQEHGAGNSRNNTAFGIATVLKDRNLDCEMAAAFIDEHWNTGDAGGIARCVPPLDWNELHQTVVSAYNPNRASYRPRGIDCPDHDFGGATTAFIGEDGKPIERATPEQSKRLATGLFEGDRLISEIAPPQEDAEAKGDDGDPKSMKAPPLTMAEWGARNLPRPDYLLGSWLHTTSRALIVGATGVGKTNFGLALAAAMADGAGFLNWPARRPAKVLYIDGEMSKILLQQRLEDVKRRLGHEAPTLFTFNHEDALDDDMFQPLNTRQGQAYVEGLIRHIGGIDFVIFDNLMSLLTGNMRETDSWAEVQPWVKTLTKRRIGQAWFHHTGHDESRSYGDKTKEWMLDTVLHLTGAKRDGIDVSFDLSFRKARERTPDNRIEFADIHVALAADAWTWKAAEKRPAGKTTPLDVAFRAALVTAMEGSADRLDGYPAVRMDQWREACVVAGLLDRSKPDGARALFSRHRRNLVAAGAIHVADDLVRLMHGGPSADDDPWFDDEDRLS